MSRSDDETRQPLLSSAQPVYSGVDGSGPPSPQGEAQQVEQRPAHRLRDGPVTPLPKLQMTALCIMRLSEPIAFLGILPFVAKMLQENMPDVPKQQIGYYIGFIESIFALVQFGTVFMWGRLSDRIGRKPVLLIGLLGTCVSINCYGLSKTFPQMIFSRSIAGLMNANIGVLKSVFGELTDETNQARAFTFIPLSFAVGSMIGPMIGGNLSNPVEGFPGLFGNSAFLAKYPYWLPCFVSSLFNIVGFLVGFFVLEETLPAKVRRKEAAAPASGEEGCTSARQDEEERRPRIRELLTRNVVTALLNSVMMNFTFICYAAVLPLFLFTTIEQGGISFSKEAIGYFLAINGAVVIFVQLFVFPPLEKRLGGPLATLRLSLTVLPLNFLCFPIAHYAARDYGLHGTLVVLAVLLLLRGFSSIMVVSSSLCVNNVVPTRSALGSINGLQQSLACLSRAAGPIFSTSLFAFSITHTYAFLDGQMVWFVFAAISLITWYLSSIMRGANEIQWRR